MGEPKTGIGAGAAARIEGLRWALLRVQGRLRGLAERERTGALSSTAVLRRRELRAEAADLTGALRQVLRSRRPPDDAGPA